MRILRVTPYFAPAWVYGGPARSVLESCRGLTDLGETVRVLTTTANGRGELDLPVGRSVDTCGVDTWYYPRAWPKSAFHSPALYRAVREQAPEFDIVQCHAMFLPLGVVVRRAAQRAGKPFICTCHGTLDPVVLRQKRLKKAIYWHLWERGNLRRAAAVVALTEEERRQVLRIAPECRVAVVPNGQPVPDLGALPSRSWLEGEFEGLAGRPYVLFLGRLSWKKGLDLLVPAFARARERHPEWMLVLAGPDEAGYRAVVDDDVRRHGLEPHVVLPGLVDGVRKEALLGNAGLFCLSSHSEGLPTAVVEALMYARPVVISNRCYMPEVGEAGAGWVVDTTVEAVAGGLSAAMGDPVERRERGLRGRDLAIDRYSREAAARRTLELYKSCIGAGGAAGRG